jgi:sigma-B regulation protein RsbU (phosphoserine phosphatase)
VLRGEKRLERDLEMARHTQLRLLPKRNPEVEGLDIGAAYSPARELGGDFFDYLRYADGRFAVAVGDVAGKATPAALLAAMTSGLLRAYDDQRPSESTKSNRFVAMAYCLFDPATATLTLANAGLPRPFCARAGDAEEIDVSGVPLGVFRGTLYVERTRTLEVGDSIALCSDGLMEEENSRGEPFGRDRVRSALITLASGSAQEIADGLVRAVREFAGNPARQSDDHTVVVLKRV